MVLGKTRMHELAVGVTTINMHGGPVLNPYNNTMHTGGPSRFMLPHGVPDMALRGDICRASPESRCAPFSRLQSALKPDYSLRPCDAQVCLCRKQRRRCSGSRHAHGHSRFLLRHGCAAFQAFLQCLPPLMSYASHSVTPLVQKSPALRRRHLRRETFHAGGSCRIPAGMTGVVGFRPTTGCWNAGDGIVPMTVSRDTVGDSSQSYYWQPTITENEGCLHTQI